MAKMLAPHNHILGSLLTFICGIFIGHLELGS